MRIAYMLGHFPTLTETFVGNEMRAMEALGHELFPIAMHDPQSMFQQQDAALVARTIYFSRIPPAQSRTLAKAYAAKKNLVATFLHAQTSENPETLFIHAAHLAEFMVRHRITHIHAHFAWAATTYAIAAAMLAGLPVSFTCHGSDVYVRPQDLALKCTSATMVIGVAPTLSSYLATHYPTANLRLLACGVDTTLFAPAEDRSQCHERWLFTGRLIDCKGVADLIEAWALLPSQDRPILDIVGEGEDEVALKALVQKLGVASSIQFLGAKTSEWLAQYGPYYRAFIAPFRRGLNGAQDTSPLVLKEAMAMGLPIVTTQFVDIPQLVGQSALLAPPGVPASMADAVMKINQMPDAQFYAMGAWGRDHVMAHYRLDQQAMALSNLFDTCTRS